MPRARVCCRQGGVDGLYRLCVAVGQKCVAKTTLAGATGPPPQGRGRAGGSAVSVVVPVVTDLAQSQARLAVGRGAPSARTGLTGVGFTAPCAPPQLGRALATTAARCHPRVYSPKSAPLLYRAHGRRQRCGQGAKCTAGGWHGVSQCGTRCSSASWAARFSTRASRAHKCASWCRRVFQAVRLGRPSAVADRRLTHGNVAWPL